MLFSETLSCSDNDDPSRNRNGIFAIEITAQSIGAVIHVIPVIEQTSRGPVLETMPVIFLSSIMSILPILFVVISFNAFTASSSSFRLIISLVIIFDSNTFCVLP